MFVQEEYIEDDYNEFIVYFVEDILIFREDGESEEGQFEVVWLLFSGWQRFICKDMFYYKKYFKIFKFLQFEVVVVLL